VRELSPELEPAGAEDSLPRLQRAMERYPLIEPFASGFLEVGDGNRVFWETSGNPDGKPALVVHGGPGSGSSPGSRRYFDPARYLVVQFDQRGCGRSTPHASDPKTDMSVNTTHRLLADMERLREQLGVDRWLLYGGSWASTLILAYAELHPERASEIVLLGATMSRRSEIDWLYRGVGRFFPAEWDKFRSVAGEDDVLAAYARLIEDGDPSVRQAAAQAWLAWEDAVISLEAHGRPNAYSDRPSADQLAFVRICAHYYSQGAWLEEGELLTHASRLDGTPGVIIHGRLDLGSPLATAWELARAWPAAQLVVVDDSGHTGSDAMREAVLTATEGFK
jgi:proline iminopeptidase